MRSWFEVSNALTRSANSTQVVKLWLRRRCSIVLIVKLSSWHPTPGVEPNWYLTPCLSIILNNRVHRMLLMILDPMSMRVNPRHLFGSEKSPLLGTGTTWPSCHSVKSVSPHQYAFKKVCSISRFWFERALKASVGTSFSLGDFQFANFLTANLTSSHLID